MFFNIQAQDENVQLRTELDAFDPAFFEEIEDLKVLMILLYSC